LREYKEIYKYEQYKDRLRVITGKPLEPKRGLEGWGSERSAGDPRYRCATLISSRENPHAPCSKTWT